MALKQKYELALDLCDRATELMDNEAPDPAWLGQYYGLTGRHMILTEEGWEPGEVKHTYAEYPDVILMEVNAPKSARKRTHAAD